MMPDYFVLLGFLAIPFIVGITDWLIQKTNR